MEKVDGMAMKLLFNLFIIVLITLKVGWFRPPTFFLSCKDQMAFSTSCLEIIQESFYICATISQLQTKTLKEMLHLCIGRCPTLSDVKGERRQ